MRNLIRLLGSLIVLGVAGIGVAFYYVNGIAETAIETGASEALGVSTEVGSVSIGLLRGSFSMSDFEVANPPGFDGEFLFEFAHTHFDIDSESLRSQTIRVPMFRLDGVRVALERNRGGTNVEAVLANLKRFEQKGSGKSASSGDEGRTLVIDEVVISDIMAYVDVSIPGAVEVDRMEVEIPEIRVRNVGGGGGLTYGELTNLLVKAILVNVAKHGGQIPVAMVGDLIRGLKPLETVSTKVGGLAGEALGAVGATGDTALRDGAKKLLGGFGGLLGGKPKD